MYNYTYQLEEQEVTVEAWTEEEAKKKATEELLTMIHIQHQYNTEPDIEYEDIGCKCNTYLDDEEDTDDPGMDSDWHWDNDRCVYICYGCGDQQ